MADAERLVELFKEANKLGAEEREAFVRKVRDEGSALAASLNELLGQEGPVPTEPGSFAQRIKDQYGSEADPNITLEGSGKADGARHARVTEVFLEASELPPEVGHCSASMSAHDMGTNRAITMLCQPPHHPALRGTGEHYVVSETRKLRMRTGRVRRLIVEASCTAIVSLPAACHTDHGAGQTF